MKWVLIFVFCGACGAALRPDGRAQDTSKGQQVFAACSVCHDPDKTDKTGPSLVGVVGRAAGAVEGFRYSRAMKKARIVWDEKMLDAFLADPQGIVPGNVMPFPGMPDVAQRADLIAYLKTLK